MSKFRLPRKIRKKLLKHIWFYPANETGSRLIASPHKIEKDYIAVKERIVKDILHRENPKAEKKAYREKMNKEVTVSDDKLKDMINTIFAERFRTSSYSTLIKAKAHSKAVIAYYNFINAYYLSETENSYENICCLAVDNAKKLLKQ